MRWNQERARGASSGQKAVQARAIALRSALAVADCPCWRAYRRRLSARGLGALAPGTRWAVKKGSGPAPPKPAGGQDGCLL
jgi:hypothetical protein